jgi:hypothetical protein
MTEKFEGPVHDLSLEAEETLRLVAQLSPPPDLTERVHARVQHRLAELPERGSLWSLWMPARRLQFAGVAVLAAAVGVSAWTVSHAHRGNQSAAPAMNGAGNGTGSGTFGNADAKRVPPSLKPILVPDRASAAPKKKPTPSRLKPAPKGTASQTSDADSKQ